MTTKAASSHRSRGAFFCAFASMLLVAFFFWHRLPISVAFDPNDEKCIPDLHLALLVHRPPSSVAHGDLVFFKPAGSLAYIKQEFALKIAAGVPGDRLQIREGRVLVNGVEVASGFPLSGVYKKTVAQFELDEVIPQGKLFLIGTHPRSDDSRYWGYIELKSLSGPAYKLL